MLKHYLTKSFLICGQHIDKAYTKADKTPFYNGLQIFDNFSINGVFCERIFVSYQLQKKCRLGVITTQLSIRFFSVLFRLHFLYKKVDVVHV